MGIYDQRLDNDLTQIRAQAAHMGQLVQAALKDAVRCLFSGNEELANLVILGDQIINRKRWEMCRLCHDCTARNLPSAGHLRFISSALRLAEELERIGDYAVNICRQTLHMIHPPEGGIKRGLEGMTRESRAMLEQALDAFNNRNPELARGTMVMADQVEHSLKNAILDLEERGQEQDASIRDLMNLYAVFYTLERISDRAKNICEETLFVSSGEMKPAKQFDILFIDEDNSCLSPMAEAIARKGFGRSARYQSAGRHPAEKADPDMLGFMARHGFDLSRFSPRGLEDGASVIQSNINSIIVSLQGPVRTYPLAIPFHTVFLQWDVGPVPEEGLEPEEALRRYEEIYREIALQIRRLLELLRGEETI